MGSRNGITTAYQARAAPLTRVGYDTRPKFTTSWGYDVRMNNLPPRDKTLSAVDVAVLIEAVDAQFLPESEVFERYGITRKTWFSLKQRYHVRGIIGLLLKPRRGRPRDSGLALAPSPQASFLVFERDGFRLDRIHCTLSYNGHAERMPLPAIHIAYLLLNRRSMSISIDAIRKNVWNHSSKPSASVIRGYVKNIRCAIANISRTYPLGCQSRHYRWR